jgi:hypothetical protein
MPCRSYLLKNEGKDDKGTVHFTDVTTQIAPGLEKIGMVSSALWTDFDNDQQTDLILTGEFMPLRIFQNLHGQLKEISDTGLQHRSGWWNSIVAGDFDEDGDMDYAVGNLGMNSRYKATVKEPLCIYAKDYDKNGLIDPVMCYYSDGHNYIYPARDEMIRQINPFRGRFSSYESYASVTFEESFREDELKDAFIVKCETFETGYFENLGGGRFKYAALPVAAQFGPVYGMLSGDYNGDGNMDILMAGNAYPAEASSGRFDAMKGTLLAGDGKGNFKEDKMHAAGFRADKDVKGLAEIYLKDGTSTVLVANNDSKLEAYRFPVNKGHLLVPRSTDVFAIIHKKSGKSYKHEFYYGNNYLSNTSRKLKLSDDVKSVTFYDNTGKSRNEFF